VDASKFPSQLRATGHNSSQIAGFTVPYSSSAGCGKCWISMSSERRARDVLLDVHRMQRACETQSLRTRCRVPQVPDHSESSPLVGVQMRGRRNCWPMLTPLELSRAGSRQRRGVVNLQFPRTTECDRTRLGYEKALGTKGV
jgi:hypothetical protein